MQGLRQCHTSTLPNTLRKIRLYIVEIYYVDMGASGKQLLHACSDSFVHGRRDPVEAIRIYPECCALELLRWKANVACNFHHGAKRGAFFHTDASARLVASDESLFVQSLVSSQRVCFHFR
jgi:hypothetical protein